jgi:hypothetical protein
MPLGRLMRCGVPVVSAVALLTGCGIGNSSGRDFCTQYRQFQKSADALRQINPATVSVSEVRAKVLDFQKELDQVLGAADGSLNSQISTLRASVQGLQEAAVTASQKGFVAARPLLKDSLTEVKQSLAAVKQAADTQCSAGSGA